MDILLKALNYILPFFVFFLFFGAWLTNKRKDKLKKLVFSDPIYVDAEIMDVFPDAPSKIGTVDVKFNYKFTSLDQLVVEIKGAEAVVKTVDLHNYHPGTYIPVAYLRTDPNKSIVNMKSETE